MISVSRQKFEVLGLGLGLGLVGEGLGLETFRDLPQYLSI